MPDKIYELEGFPRWIEHDWEKWYDISRSYRRAINFLLGAEAPERDGYSERDILPSLHLIHLYAELILKCLLVKAGRPFAFSHDLAELKEAAAQIHPDLFDGFSWEFLDRLNSMNPAGAAFKYPGDRKGLEHFTGGNGTNTLAMSEILPAIREHFRKVDGLFAPVFSAASEELVTRSDGRTGGPFFLSLPTEES